MRPFNCRQLPPGTRSKPHCATRLEALLQTSQQEVQAPSTHNSNSPRCPLKPGRAAVAPPEPQPCAPPLHLCGRLGSW